MAVSMKNCQIWKPNMNYYYFYGLNGMKNKYIHKYGPVGIFLCIKLTHLFIWLSFISNCMYLLTVYRWISRYKSLCIKSFNLFWILTCNVIHVIQMMDCWPVRGFISWWSQFNTPLIHLRTSSEIYYDKPLHPRNEKYWGNIITIV